MMKAILITPLLVLVSTVAKAQDVPPLPPLRGDVASLKDTMKFIQEKLPGTVNYMVYGRDNLAGTDSPPYTRSFVLTEVSADAGRCYIGFRAKFDNGKDNDGEILLKQVQEISLMQLETLVQRAEAKAGHPERSVKVDPPITLLEVKSAPNHSMMFPFYDDALSERVSKALKHAVSLCGGGKPETF